MDHQVASSLSILCIANQIILMWSVDLDKSVPARARMGGRETTRADQISLRGDRIEYRNTNERTLDQSADAAWGDATVRGRRCEAYCVGAARRT